MKTINTPSKCCADIADNCIIRWKFLKDRDAVVKLIEDTMADYLQDWNGQNYRTVQAGTKSYSVPLAVEQRLMNQQVQINNLERLVREQQRDLNNIKS